MPLVKGSLDGEGEAEARDLETLLAELEAPEADRRRAAAIELEGHPEALGAVMDRLEQEENPEVSAALVIPILRNPNRDVAKRLADMMRGDEAELRTIAVDVLRQFPDEASEVLVALLDDEDEDVRVLTTNTLQFLNRPDVEALLVGRLEREEDANVVGAIVEALLEVGTAHARPALEAARSRFEGEEFLIFAIEATLQRVGEEDA